jgi:hypothetical protein
LRLLEEFSFTLKKSSFFELATEVGAVRLRTIVLEPSTTGRIHEQNAGRTPPHLREQLSRLN